MGKSKRMIEAKWADRKDEWARKLELADNPEFRKDYNAVTGFGVITAIMFSYSAIVALMTSIQYAFPDHWIDNAWVNNLYFAGFLGVVGFAMAAGAVYLNWKLMDKKWGV